MHAYFSPLWGEVSGATHGLLTFLPRTFGRTGKRTMGLGRVYTALSDLTIAPPFIPPIAKAGNGLSFLFFCFKWGALVGCLVHLCTLTLVLYGAEMK